MASRQRQIATFNSQHRWRKRGLGIVPMPHGDAPVALLCDLFDQVDRMPPEGLSRAVAGLQVPVIKIAPFEVSAAIKVELALRTLAPR